MAAKDRIHRAVRNALVADGWTITHDPYRLTYESDAIEIDMAAERVIAATRGDELVAVEVKSFLSQSPLRDFQAALGQFEVYTAALLERDPDRKLFLAITTFAFQRAFAKPLIRLVMQSRPVPLLVVDVVAEEIDRWIP
jgi:hypothetical protein